MVGNGRFLGMGRAHGAQDGQQDRLGKVDLRRMRDVCAAAARDEHRRRRPDGHGQRDLDEEANGARGARIDQSKAAWEEQVASYTGTLLVALQEVEQSLSNVQALADQQQYREEAYTQAEEAYRVAQVRYQEGETELTDVLSAQSSFNNARQNSLELIYNQYQSRVTLYRVLGASE